MKTAVILTVLFALGLPLGAQTLDPSLQAGLVQLREEEKLAHDVYTFLSTQNSRPVFKNISQSEQTHYDRIGDLLKAYTIPDPSLGYSGLGEFKDPAFAKLYRDLTTQGSQSYAAALEVGSIIEKLDIKDLEEQLKKTLPEDVKLVYQSLVAGSQNHLKAFSR